MTQPGRTEPIGVATHIWRASIRGALWIYLGALRAAIRFGPPPRPARGPRHILLTGTFHSDNWIRSHLGPLSASAECLRVTMVTTTPLPQLPKVTPIFPPRWLVAIVGRVPGRLLTFAAAALWLKPDVVGGFHLLVNGLVAALLGRVVGAESWQLSVGGPTELIDGGVWGENPHFTRLRVPDPIVEGRLLEAVRTFDVVITMGTSAGRFLRDHGVSTRIEVIPGGIDASVFEAARRPREFDLILVARLVPIKQVDLFLRVVRIVQGSLPGVKAAIVRDGPLRAELELLARELGISGAVTFAGKRTDVSAWLARSKVFALTSSSEGLALSLMEAMTCGLPAIVCHVGDLGDLVDDGKNGYLVADCSPPAIGAAALRLLGDPERYARFAESARQAGRRYTATAATARWNEVLAPDATESD